MTTLIAEENTTAATTASSKKPKPNKKARVAARRANVATARAKSARKAMPAKKTPKRRTKREVAKPKVARDGSKTAKILDLLKRPGGVTSKDLGLTVTSTKGENGERTYSVEA
jgi:hypothetical protein